VLGGTVGTAVDTVTGFGLVENIVSTGERIKSVTVRSVELVAGDNSTVVLTVSESRRRAVFCGGRSIVSRSTAWKTRREARTSGSSPWI
jgi:hypothetical protein